MKPDVCRRVVRQTVAGFQPLAFGLQLNPGKPRATSRQRPLSRSKGGVAYLVRSSGLRPEQFSHDWHVQPSCQRPNRSPPERCASVQPGAHKGVSGCPRNSFKLQVPPSPCQPIVPTGFPPVFHNRGATTEGPNLGTIAELHARSRTAFRVQTHAFSARAKAEAGSLKKDLVEVRATNAKTLRGTLSPNENPVAGAVQVFPVFKFDAGRATRVAKNARLATHCSRRNCLYQMNAGNARGSLPTWFGERRY